MPELSEDEALQALTDKIAAWYESGKQAGAKPDNDQQPKSLLPDDIIRRGTLDRDDCPVLTVVAVYMS